MQTKTKSDLKEGLLSDTFGLKKHENVESKKGTLHLGKAFSSHLLTVRDSFHVICWTNCNIGIIAIQNLLKLKQMNLFSAWTKGFHHFYGIFQWDMCAVYDPQLLLYICQ